ncbi:hypothetical protein [Mycobacterium sp. 852014-52144_SCH5372336]|uniref:hypothetical protein n=1 Tax=Mycobacterium sp. 852014-52144_SCH5372336 TaxID=1834115 RepID=UPI0008021D59|nr:hypothetical protein [Mycobacterium sp. 852014-52144_SCH5372336]OBB76811.1 hypothetical protein A5759_05245 [Mycobacterium sp. 852014-52144_SCH5372336]
MSDNAFDETTLELPNAADLRRAIEAVILWRREDTHGVAVVLAEAEREHRLSFTIAALLYLVNHQADRLAEVVGVTDVETSLRQLQAALACSEDEERDD